MIKKIFLTFILSMVLYGIAYAETCYWCFYSDFIRSYNSNCFFHPRYIVKKLKEKFSMDDIIGFKEDICKYVENTEYKRLKKYTKDFGLEFDSLDRFFRPTCYAMCLESFKKGGIFYADPGGTLVKIAMKIENEMCSDVENYEKCDILKHRIYPRFHTKYVYESYLYKMKLEKIFVDELLTTIINGSKMVDGQ